MDKEDFLRNYILDYEDWESMYEICKDYLDDIDLSNYEFAYPDDIVEAVECELSYMILEDLCSYCFNDPDLYWKNEDALEELFDGWSAVNIAPKGLEINLDAFVEAVKDALESNNVKFHEPKYNPYEIEHKLNEGYTYKFICC